MIDSQPVLLGTHTDDLTRPGAGLFLPEPFRKASPTPGALSNEQGENAEVSRPRPLEQEGSKLSGNSCLIIRGY